MPAWEPIRLEAPALSEISWSYAFSKPRGTGVPVLPLRAGAWVRAKPLKDLA